MSLSYKRRGIKSFIAWLLVIAIFVISYGVPLGDGIKTAYAAEDEQQNDTEYQQDTDDTEELFNIDNIELSQKYEDDVKANQNVKGTEIIEKRDEYSKHFQLENGACEVVLYGCPVHYLEDGEYKEIDNTLNLVRDSSGNQVYENTSNELKVQISPNSNKATVYKDEYSLTWTIVGILQNKTGQKEVGLTEKEWSTKSEGEKRLNIPNFSSMIKYEDVMPDIDLEYVVVSNQLKENIIFNRKTDITVITEQVKAKGLTLIKNDDGSIDAVDSETREKIFYIPPTFLIDNEGEVSENIGLEITSHDNTHTLTYTLDKEWMDKATYPVVFDPTATVNTGSDGSYVIDNRICKGYNNNYKNSYIMCTGNGSSSKENWSLIKFTNLPSINGNQIYYAKLQAKMIRDASSTSTVAVHQATSYWNQDVRWSSRPTLGGAYSTVSVAPTQYVTYTWNITGIARNWYSNNYGLSLKDTSSSSNYKEWATWQSGYHDGPKAYFYYDNVAPSAPTSMYTAPGASSTWTNDTTLTLHWSGITDSGGSGLKQIVYRVDGGSWVYPSTSYGVASGSVPITISSTGTHSIQIRAIDNVNNWGTTKTIYYKLDRTAPSLSSISVTDNSPSDWETDATPTLSWSGFSDSHSGRSRMQYKSCHNGVWTSWTNIPNSASSSGTYTLPTQASGTYTYKMRSVDKAGNVSSEKSVTYKLDTADPGVPLIQEITANQDGSYDKDNAQISIKFDATSDSGSGIAYYKVIENGVELADSVSPGVVNVLSGGRNDSTTYNYKVKVYDNAGRHNESSNVPFTTLDKTAPVIDPDDVSMPSDWTSNTTPTITWQDIDDGDGGGTTAMEYQLNSTGTWLPLGTSYAVGSGTADCSALNDGTHTINVRAKDSQNNISNVVDLTYKKDTVFDDTNVYIQIPDQEDVVNEASFNIEFVVNSNELTTWDLDYASGTDPDENLDYTNITSGDTATQTSFSQDWDLSTLEENRFYTLRLTAKDAAYNTTVKHYRVLYTLDANKIDANISMSLIDVDEDIKTDSVTVQYNPDTDMLGKLYVNDELKSEQLNSGDTLTFNPLEYSGGWVYPEGSQVFMRVTSKDSNGDVFFSNTTYQRHEIVDVFDEENGPTNFSNTVYNNSRVELAETSVDVYSSDGSFESETSTINGRICYVNLTVDDIVIENVADIQYFLVYDNGEKKIERDDLGTNVELNISTNNIYLRADMTSDTTDTPSIRSWHLDVMYIPFSESTIIENGFEDNARGFCGLDDTEHIPIGDGSIELFGIDNPIKYYEPEGYVLSTVRTTPGSVYEIYLDVTDETDENVTDIEYYLSTDGGSTWSINTITPDEWIPVKNLGANMQSGNQIVLKAKLTRASDESEETPVLSYWKLACRQTMAGEAHDIKLIDEPDKLSTLVNANYTTLLRWEESETPDVTYNIYRSTTPYFDYTVIGPLETGITENYWNDSYIEFLEPDEKYYYKVTAVRNIEVGTDTHPRESLPSNEAWADPVSEDAIHQMLGLQNYWSYSGFKAGAGTGYVNVANGNMVYKTTDLMAAGPFYASVMSRTYNSLGETKTPLGYGWDYSFNTTLLRVEELNEATQQIEKALILKDGDGSFHRFVGDDNTGYTSAKGTFMQLETVEENNDVVSYKITRKDGIVYYFNAVTMRLIRFTDLNGKELSFEYDSRGNVWKIYNSVDGLVELNYNVECQMPDDSDYAYVNNHIDMLDTVTWTNNGSTIEYKYTYDIKDRVEAVTATIGENQLMIESFDYDADLNSNNIKDDCNIVITDAEGRITVIILSENGKVSKIYEPVTTLTNYSSADKYIVNLNPDNDQSGDRTTIMNDYGVGVSYEYNSSGLLTKKTDSKGNEINYTHNTDYLVTSVSYKNTIDGVVTTIRNKFEYTEDEFGFCTGNIAYVTLQVLNTTTGLYENIGPQTHYYYENSNFPNKPTKVENVKDIINGATHWVTTTNEYDPNGNIKTVTVADGSTCTYDDATSGDIEKKTTYAYYPSDDSNGYEWQLKSVTDEYGKEIRYIYDTDDSNTIINGLLLHVEEYDTSGNYVRTLKTYDYDDFCRTKTVSDVYVKNGSNPNLSYIKYDGFGRLEQTINFDSTSEFWEYDDTGRLKAHGVGVDNGFGFQAENWTNNYYDNIGRITKTTIENDSTNNRDTDDANDVVSSVDYNYNNSALGISNGKWDSDTTITGVDADVIVATNPEGTKTFQYYDILGRLDHTVIFDGSSYITTGEYEYDKIGNMTQVKDSAGRVSRAYYDALNRQTKTVVDPFDSPGTSNMNFETEYEYDFLGNTTKVTQVAYTSESDQTATNYITEYEYDDLSRLTKVTQENPSYDPMSPTDPADTNYDPDKVQQYLVTSYYYDRAVTDGTDDRIMNYIIDPKGYVKETYFDLMGHKVKVRNEADTTDSVYMETLYEYDYTQEIRGMVTKATRTDGTFEKYEYDDMGRATSIKYYEDGATPNTYPNLDPCTEKVDYVYNDLGQLWTQSSTIGTTTHDTSYRYDRMGRTTSVWEGTWNNDVPDKVANGLDVEYTYNDASQIEVVNYKSSQTAKDQNIGYSYDSFGRISNIKLNPDQGVDDNIVRAYFYDNTTGELDYTRDYRQFGTVTGTTLGDYIQTDYAYNSAGMVKKITYTDTALGTNTDGITEQYEVEYDGRGFIVSEDLGIDYSTTEDMVTLYKAYDYDSLGRLIRAGCGEDEATGWNTWAKLNEYTYDVLGNRKSLTNKTYDEQTSSQVTGDVFNYKYTQFNQLDYVNMNGSMFEECVYDLRGNQIVKKTDFTGNTAGEAIVYSYDLMNRMEDVGTTSNMSQTLLANATYMDSNLYSQLTDMTTINSNIYNAGGQRTEKTEEVDDGQGGTAPITERYFYSGSALLYTKDGDGSMKTENILDLNGHIIASMRFDDDDDQTTFNEWEGQYFFYHYDIRGSVTAIVKPNGESVKEYTYDEFGNLTSTGESSFDNEVTFTSSITDMSTGLQYMNSRFYEPSTGRFISQDSYSGNVYEPWTQHLYSYCGNNPTNFVDPTGHKPVEFAMNGRDAKNERWRLKKDGSWKQFEPTNWPDPDLKSTQTIESQGLVDQSSNDAIVDVADDFLVTGAEHSFTVANWFIDDTTINGISDSMDALSVLDGSSEMFYVYNMAEFSKNNHKLNIKRVGEINNITGEDYYDIACSMDLYPVIISKKSSALHYRDELGMFCTAFGTDPEQCYAEYGTFYSGIAELTKQAGNKGIEVANSVCGLATGNLYYDLLGMLADGLSVEYEYEFIYGQMGVK